MTIKQALSRAREILTANNIQDAPLESELLLRHALEIDQVQLYLDLNQELNPDSGRNFWHLIKRRLNHEPTAYITGHCEFYGLDFCVDSRVFIPRPESELLVEEAMKFIDQSLPRASLVAEVGTGSGAIAVALARYRPQVKIYASDISAAALEVAAINCQRHDVESRVQLILGSTLEALPEPVDLIVANPPYIRDSEIAGLCPEIHLFEPKAALAGGQDGLDKVRKLCREAVSRLRPNGCLLMEIGEGQAEAVTSFLQPLFPSARIVVIPDLSQIDRVVQVH